MPTQVNCETINDAFALNVYSVPVTCTCIVVGGNSDSRGTRQGSPQRKIGEISFNARNIIGCGYSGTRVFRGLFEGKQPVAVKRTDHFEMGDREANLLRPLCHPNLVRYYASESDGMFRYIAMELADMTFADYVERKTKGECKEMNDITFLEQISKGLECLHSRDIIHCDIRPQNVLISAPMRPKDDRKAIITDFSISNELASDHIPLSLTVADGWIAPEVLRSRDGTFRPKKSIDVFALGCLFYYVLTNGKHPFGDRFHRQGNVYDGRFDINELKGEESLCKYHLIAAMIDDSPKRPPMDAVLKHPMFWHSERSLSFIKNVNSRMEEERGDSSLLNNLECRAAHVIKGNWMDNIAEELQEDLRSRFNGRQYDGSSVKALLRAIRNKVEHYNELSEAIEQLSGSTPQGLVSYFTQKFPLLLVHTYIVMQQCKDESVFREYYSDSFNFQSLPEIESH